MEKKTAYLLDIGYLQKGEKPALRMLLKDPQSNRSYRAYDDDFEPYFYLKPEREKHADIEKLKEEILKTTAWSRNEKLKAKRVEETERKIIGKEEKFLKIICNRPSDVTSLRDELKKFGETYEHGIQFTKRYLIDKALIPCEPIEMELEGRKIISVKRIDREEKTGMEKDWKSETDGEEKAGMTGNEKSEKGTEDEKSGKEGNEKAEKGKIPELKMNTLAFDIETYNPKGMPEMRTDPVIMIGFAGKEETGLLTYKKIDGNNAIVHCKSEKEMLEHFGKILKERKTDLLCSYNGDVFDVPYLAERAKATKAEMFLGRDKALPKSKQLGLRKQASLNGRIHFDVFAGISFMNTIGAVKLQRLTLENVYKEILGGQKGDVKKDEIWKIWDSEDAQNMKKLAEYCMVDAQAAYELGEHILPLEIALSRVSGLTLFEASRSTAGQLVEILLMREAFRSRSIILNKPRFEEVEKRSANPIEGAFVKVPSPGVYENMAVLDFRSLYPSIIISHNIDLESLNCKCCTKEESSVSPQGHRFCKKKKGLIPRVLEEVLKGRFAAKEKMKKLKSEGKAETKDYRDLDAKQWALKILANSFYGYMGYARSRYYSRECAESVTAFARDYIKKTMETAEGMGLKVLYGDTDSIFLQFDEDNEGSVKEFQRKINSELPEAMELELEDIYPRGIFVGKKQQEEKGAKKKYALINKEGKIKIRGFELVRRDWSKIAKETQRKVLELILKEGNVEKAVAEVKRVVKELSEGKVPLEELVIYTQLKKNAASYEIMSPEVAAFLRAKRAGLQIEEMSLVPYIITKQKEAIPNKNDRSGKSRGKQKRIYEQAQVLELAKDYDPEYYINNQVMPAVLKILGALGYDEHSLKFSGSQKSLSGW